MTLLYAAFFIASFIFSILINALFLRLSKTLGIRDKKETVIRWASTSKPALGGISFFIVFLMSLASYSMFFQGQEVLWNKKIAGLLVTVTIAFMMGLGDDAYNTKPFLKLFVQILCGIILCYSGIYISIFSNIILNYALTIIWVVGIMNSINMLDNMDGIATIVSICIFTNAMLVIYLSGELASVYFFILLGLVASLLGFLRFNWHPSKLYMGDTGSQILGMLLATIGIIYFWNNSLVLSRPTSVAQQIVIVTITFILPLADTTIVVINRLLRKKSPFVGGRDHTTHNLFFKGVTEKRIAVLFASIGLLSIGLVYIIESTSNVWENKMLAIFALFPVVLFIFLFSITKFKKATVHPAVASTHPKVISNNREVVSKSSPVESATNGYPPYVEEHLT